jgi:hypothetical protein
VLAGDIDSRWTALAAFKDWPVPVIFVAGNHEFDRRELREAWPALRAHAEGLGIRMLECEDWVMQDADGRRIRFLGTVRWCDFDVFGPAHRAKALRAGSYFQRVMGSTIDGQCFDAAAVREEALRCRDWLAQALAPARTQQVVPPCDRTVVVTHFAPSLRSADPRYPDQLSTASFCNADDDLLPQVDFWIHGHLHCRQDYLVPHAHGHTRVVCQARGHAHKGEADAYAPATLFDV